MKQLLTLLILLLIVGNTLTLIGLTANVSDTLLGWSLYAGPIVTGVAVLGISAIFIYARRQKRKQDRSRQDL